MRKSAFTLIELLVVVAIIVALLAILLPSMGRAIEIALSATCQSNQRQLQAAWIAYPADHFGNIISAATTESGTYGAANAWVKSNNDGNETLDHLRNGALAPYTGEQVELYLCPNEDRTTYVRSYSLPSSLNGTMWSGWIGYLNMARSMSMIEDPSQRLAFMDDSDPRGQNLGGWAHFPLDYPEPDVWSDWPASRHLKGCTQSFADGHTEYYEFRDAMTAQISWFATPAPNSADFEYYQRLFSP